VTAVAATTNAALSALFVLVLDFGIAGSAWGTVTAQTGAGIAYVALIRRAAGGSAISMRPHLDGMRQSARTGGALFVRTVSLRAVFLLAAAVAARLGDADLAAYQVAMTTWFLLALAHDSLAIAAQAMVGRNLGAGAVEAAHALTRVLARWGLGLGIVLGLLLLIVMPVYVPLFTDDPVVVSALTGALIVVAAQQPLAGPVFVWDGVLIGAGDARWLAGAQTVMFVLFAPAAVAVLALDGSLVGLWLALTWFMLVRGLVLWRRVRTDDWAVPGLSR
jgi:putative MATE family efflux protein